MRTSLPRLVLEHRRTLAALLAGIAVLAGLSSVRGSTDGPVVISAARDLPSGRSLTAADVRSVRLTDTTVPRAALTSVSQAVGRRLAGGMRQGELLTDRRVLGRGPLEGRAAGSVLTTIRLGDADGLGAVRVGDEVDVVAVDPERQDAARVVARQLEVLATRETDGSDGALVDLAATEEGALDLAEAGLRSRLTVLVSTAGQAPR
ncbi:hypothetical protein ASD11_12585 [Aeromicrobium sp. Root495]|uniref:SAF domain-containing protein n=1 Tax=Aeromicrobium sp. Root495 TaxID=1736550 RepID=UPI0006FBA870|nr:SAF domain-containing protein [Aeromicrobium sp. Root495]KQY60290.1 hypothetical protein ASD11_12585 [Aeromicrobium sp. Root495]